MSALRVARCLASVSCTPSVSTSSVRFMTISSTYRTNGVGVMQKAVQEQLAHSCASSSSPALLAERLGDASSAASSGNAVSLSTNNGAGSSHGGGAKSEDSIGMARLVSELERRGSLHRSTLAAIESSKEWKDYDAHVTFELMLLRHRYQSTDTPMTAARRSQMQAHLRQKQLQVMEEHAQRAAKQYVRSLTFEEIEALKNQFLRLDAVGVALESLPSVPRVSESEMRAAFAAVHGSVEGRNQGGADGAAGPGDDGSDSMRSAAHP